MDKYTDITAKCKKCGNVSGARGVSASTLYNRVENTLVRKCNRCGYVWTEKCLDEE